MIGLALSLYLELRVQISPAPTPLPSTSSHNCTLSYTPSPFPTTDTIPLSPTKNLITRTTLYVLACHSIPSFPPHTHITITNNIPLGRGLGSSGAAVIAGVLLASSLLPFPLSPSRLLDFALMIERHPDNVAAALHGGLVGTYLTPIPPPLAARPEVPLSEVLPEPAGGALTGLPPPPPPSGGVGHFKKFRWAPEIKCIAIIPTSFAVPTADARRVLPSTYDRQDLVFNLQRVALLVSALGDSPPDPKMIGEAMQDRVHQPYRGTLIPGLGRILDEVTHERYDGLLGICLSGAGPTVLALATGGFDAIAGRVVHIFADEGIEAEWKVLEPAHEGAVVEGDLEG